MDNIDEEITHFSFNQDGSCFTLATDLGFRVFNTSPFRLCFRRDFSGGLGIAEILDRTNLIALVGGGKSPRYHPNRVIFWDDHQMRSTWELCMRSPVKAIKLRRDRVGIVLETKIYVYNLYDLKLRDKIHTAPNPKGLCCLSADSNTLVLASPDLARGAVLIKDYHSDTVQSIPLFTHNLASIALNYNGSSLAAACERGNTIRLVNTADGTVIKEFSRGIDRVTIEQMCFHPNSEWLACISEKGTLQIYSTTGLRRSKTLFQLMKPILPKALSSESVFAQFKLKDCKCVCSFVGSEDLLSVLDLTNGNYYLLNFNSGNKSCEVIHSLNVLGVE